MTEKTDEPKFWVDKDVPPYVRGENPHLDKLIDELTEKLIEDVNNGKFSKKDSEDNK